VRAHGAAVSQVLEASTGDVYRTTGDNGLANAALERRLRAEGVLQLVLAGIKTDLGIKSTARAAADSGRRVFIAADATAARTERQHVGALRILTRGGSVVVLTETVAAALDP
jgi:nicotinamidase-related amidase